GQRADMHGLGALGAPTGRAGGGRASVGLGGLNHEAGADRALTEPASALTVPFLSYTDAEVARRCLSAGADLYHGAVQRELTVIGSDLIIRLTSEDPGLLQISTASLLSRLSIVVQTMQHFVPPVFVKHRPGKGG
uniref:L antigen family member 3 n=1 Tax=Catagonus wagneri TaxID=51154 RepID=A0A8C3VL61_9CETA